MFAEQAIQAPFYTEEKPVLHSVATSELEHVFAPPGHFTQAGDIQIYPWLHLVGTVFDVQVATFKPQAEQRSPAY